MHFLSLTDISMVIYHYGAIAARGSEGAKLQNKKGAEYGSFQILAVVIPLLGHFRVVIIKC